jgi:hypothetical protein
VGLIEQIENQKFRPVVQNTQRGTDVMRGVSALVEPLMLAAELLKKLDARKVTQPPPAAEAIPETASEPALELPSETEQKRSVEVASPSAAQAIAPSGEQPNYVWTWRLLAAGFSADDCRHIRGVEAEVVLDHALRAVEHGLRVELEWFLSAAQVAKLEEVVGREPPERIRPLLARLPKEIRYEHIQLFLRCRLAK